MPGQRSSEIERRALTRKHAPTTFGRAPASDASASGALPTTRRATARHAYASFLMAAGSNPTSSKIQEYHGHADLLPLLGAKGHDRTAESSRPINDRGRRRIAGGHPTVQSLMSTSSVQRYWRESPVGVIPAPPRAKVAHAPEPTSYPPEILEMNLDMMSAPLQFVVIRGAPNRAPCRVQKPLQQ